MGQSQNEAGRALAALPSGLFLMTAAFDGKRAGVSVRSVQPCADEPQLISVALRKGHWIEPLIRDSRAFAICLVNPGDKLVMRKFFNVEAGDEHGDPFDSLSVDTLATGSPVLRKAELVLDCEVVRHFDLEADHELYIGQVMAARVGSTNGEH